MRTEEESRSVTACQDWMSLLRTLERDQILQVLSDGFCQNCQVLLKDRIHKKVGDVSFSSDNNKRAVDVPSQSGNAPIARSSENASMESCDKRFDQQECTPPQTIPIHSSTQRGYTANSWPASINSKRNSVEHSASPVLFNDATRGDSSFIRGGLLEDPNKHNRVLQVGREKDFIHIENINGRRTNVLQGLELHTQVFNANEQKEIVDCVYNLQRMGQRGQLRERTYSEPRKWMRGKGRVTIQFGCCYNYAVDRNGNPPGIVRNEDVDPLPPLFKQMIKRMVSWHILPPTCIPDSCIVNIYDEGDCIPPHIDHHDFVRPFCTVSFLTECDILFGSNLKVVGPGEFSGPVSLPLPVGSVLILNGNAADIAKHCVPGVPARRISITFRKMDNSKIPYNFSHDPELQEMKPFVHSPFSKSKIPQDEQGKPYSYFPVKSQVQHNLHQDDELNRTESKSGKKRNINPSFVLEKDDFPPLGSLRSVNRRNVSRQ
ncbi:PREDICTED: RNA demethylase ALKBH5 [Prunus dulcis]|uniref:PREDICTED: RNA demethylase ALKBH5 n=1 Tax=Prunus dulcis TaxID=3755 RepID=A0A5E4F040_PRUDU|nr:RNA demethylase ALKBH9B-like [Prunus dulcis]VVA21303.1 PREDICTED: RNA demethylase ALKBH5 [Prunus dulcis]